MRFAILVLFLLLTPIITAHETDTPHNEPGQCAPTETADPNTFMLPALLIALGVIGILTYSFYQRTWIILAALFILAVGFTLLWLRLEINSDTITGIGAYGSTHEHADVAVVVNNQLVDLTNDYYLTYIGHYKSRFVHLHNPDSVVHKHATGVTYAYFFKTIGVPVNDDCIDIKGTPVCNATFIINGQQVDTLNVEIHDGDRALFHYGAGNASILFEQAVGNIACMYSNTCPERGRIEGCSS